MVDRNRGRLPHWPAALNKKLAASYCGLSVDVFVKVCLVKPISFTGTKRGERFLRHRLDEWLLSIDPNSNNLVALAGALHFGEALAPSTRQPKENATPLRQLTGPSGWPVAAEKNSRLQKYYDRLGFDPLTMNDADMQRLHDEADAAWEAAVPATPLQKREITTLLQLLQAGSGGKTDRNVLKSCRWDTEQRLLARGFVETLPSEKYSNHAGYLILTAAGYEVARSIDSERPGPTSKLT